jgi:hypothetical protein
MDLIFFGTLLSIMLMGFIGLINMQCRQNDRLARIELQLTALQGAVRLIYRQPFCPESTCAKPVSAAQPPPCA